jgi:hypothetical protein
MSFLARPDEEYLNEMAQQSVYATYLYLKNLEKQSKSFNINNRDYLNYEVFYLS